MRTRSEGIPRINLPWVNISPDALMALDACDDDVLDLLWRHLCGDWGKVSDDDSGLNDINVGIGDALLGIYDTSSGQPLVVLTEAVHFVAHVLTLAEHRGGRESPIKLERSPALLTSIGTTPAVPLGTVTLSPAAIHALVTSGGTPLPFLRRHAQADWGKVSEHERRLNRRWLADNGTVLSRYETMLGDMLLVETYAGRQSTTMILPEEK